jgi:hypothetical protein
VFATCLFCHSNLGANEAIEHFPVGRRLAFDAAKGRLWVVCKACERWNLTPLEERWEAIEECEKAFGETRLRVSTEHVGLAKLREGTTLIRIGDPQRPEMAAWRYGDQFYRRRRKHLLMLAGGTAVVGGAVLAGPVLGLLGGVSISYFNISNLIYQNRTIARVTVKDTVLKLNKPMLKTVRLLTEPTGGFALEIPHRRLGGKIWFAKSWNPRVVLAGDDASAAARQLLPGINQAGGSRSTIADAVEVLEANNEPKEMLARLASSSKRHGWGAWDMASGSGEGVRISLIPAALRFALEMSLHEEDERRALEGELSILEDRWREAEEVAAISDDMFVSPGVTSLLKKLRGEGTGG